jgi:hypothetical protein
LDAASGGAADLDSVPQETDDRCELLRAKLGNVAALRCREDDVDLRTARTFASAVEEIFVQVGAVPMPRVGVWHVPPFMGPRAAAFLRV